MNRLALNIKDARLTRRSAESISRKLMPEIEAMGQAAKNGYEDDRASINLPVDTHMLNHVKALAEKKKALRPEYLVLVGIGGSNLGTMAVQEAVTGKFHNEREKIKVLYADTVDSDLLDDMLKVIEPTLKRGRNIVLNAVSKSGGTTETIANFEVLLKVLRKHRKDYEKYVVVTTDEGSRFHDHAVKKGFDVLTIPDKVGGRYSVFSPVGLFPLALLGIRTEGLLRGAEHMRRECLKPFSKNPAAKSAATIYAHRRRNICDLFLFSSDLESVGRWYRQLMGESIGKEFSRKGKRVNTGITPTVSIGSTDLHSMVQLFLGGPQDKLVTFVRLEKNKSKVKIPRMKEYDNLVENIQGRPLKEVMEAILEGTLEAFRKGKRPFMEIVLPDKSEESIGQLLQLKMMEMMYLGFLMDVNPFDQPNVEAYKKETRSILTG